jgi:hypothetical protein
MRCCHTILLIYADEERFCMASIPGQSLQFTNESVNLSAVWTPTQHIRFQSDTHEPTTFLFMRITLPM